MAVDFSTDSPLASALQSIVQPKLAEFGWTTGGDDTTIFEYILLMLANDKNEAQIASELSNDLLDLGPENPETQQFAHWLFEQISNLRRQLGGDDGGAGDNQMDMNNASTSAQDTEMEGAADSSQGNIPTGPKAMRNGSSSKPVRGGRMLNQLNKQMNRPDDSALHRVRGSQGTGRINSHGREPPKGPRGQNVGRGIDAMANGRGMGNVGNINMGPGGMNGMNGMGGGIPGMQMPGGMNQNAGMMLNPQQQMALMQMYEQQAQMMQQILTGQNPAPYVNPNFHQRKKPFNDRSRQASKQGMTPSTKFVKKEGQDEAMADGTAAEGGEGMDVENSRPDPFSTMCKFNLRCGKPDCHFAHQSPAAPEGTPVDMKDTCTYGVACANHKCVGRHPSPAQRQKYQSEQECAFYPNCRDPANCPYKHPSAPPCRNGPDCTTPGCKFWHSSVPCKYNPCTNLRCPYKHVEGQKKAAHSNVWVAPKNGEEQKKDHVSERKFVEEGAEEELIIPGKTGEDTDVQL
ncbi:hypothetical protein BS50DRAFT_557118 [Corynespora cassiicola Philippines]|uniref:Nab2-like CCCH zinc finger domain-containing protein n=1 Tax=Corynespora cassiicola Philippines TaxID=1448308 RepID=A0A2T2NGI0_CORCC|nr:hypothetical protein BS50DRAFT_557118 [Corynespora cassiicola Philippines]